MMTSAQRNFLTGSFNPMSLSPALWLSDTGSDLGVWPDMSGNGRNATQATAANQPDIITGGLNGRQVRRFNGSSDYLTHQYAVSSDSTIFAVAYSTRTESSQYNIIFSAADQNTQLKCFMMSQTNTSNNWGTFRSGNISSGHTLRTSFQIASIVATAAGVSMKTGSNAAVFVADTTFLVDPNNSRRTVGASYSGGSGNGLDYFKGDIAEILVFPTALSDTDRQAVESYLRTKWGTP